MVIKEAINCNFINYGSQVCSSNGVHLSSNLVARDS